MKGFWETMEDYYKDGGIVTMTKREQAEIFVKHGTCSSIDYYISCEDCYFKKECKKYPSESTSVVAPKIGEKYLKENPEMTKTERIEEMEKQLAALKAEVKEEELVDYPCVMVNTHGDQIVLMRDGGSGLRIAGDYRPHLNLINNSDSWIPSHFKPYDGIIQFKNGKPV